MIQKNSCQPKFFSSTSYWISLVAVVAFLFATSLPVLGQMKIVPSITTAAGDGVPGNTGDGGPATSAELFVPSYVVADKVGNLYIAEFSGGNKVRKVDTATGIITTVAGSGVAGFSGDGGPAVSAQLSQVVGLAIDSTGNNLYIADNANNRIRLVNLGTGIITTVVGNGTASSTGDGGAASSATINNPAGLTFDNTGNLYIVETDRVRKLVTATGIITTVAGNGVAGFSGDDGLATSATLSQPNGITCDTSNNVYIGDAGNNRIRKITVATGVITTVAGNGTAGFSGDGGTATSAELNQAIGVQFDNAGNLYIGDTGNNRIREVAAGTGIITTVAGNGTVGHTGDGGPATGSELNSPQDLAFDSIGNIYFNESSGNFVRKLAVTANNFPATTIGASSAVQNIFLQTTAAETITSITVPQSQGGKQEYTVGTITGCIVGGASNPVGTICTIPVTFTPAYPGRRGVPLQVVTSSGNINFGLTGVGQGPLVALTPGTISTIAGNGTSGEAGDGGPATAAELNDPTSIAIDYAGDLYIPEFSLSNRVRKINAATGVITTFAGTGTAGFSGDGGPASNAQLSDPSDIAFDSAGNTYIVDDGNHRVREVSAATGIITTVAGNGTAGFAGDGGPATSAQLFVPIGIATDSEGNLYVGDGQTFRIRKVNAATGIITTVAGNGTEGFTGDGGPATSAEIGSLQGIVVDSSDNLYFADPTNFRVRRVDAATGIITTVAGNGTDGFTGDGGPATSAELGRILELGIDNANNIYIANAGAASGGPEVDRIRKVDAITGIITTVAGSGATGFAGDGGPATSAQLNGSQGVALDSVGNLYIVDLGNVRVRKVNVSQSALVYPTATTAGTSDATDDPQAVTVSNIGNASLTVAPSSSGNNPSVSANFALDSATTCPQLFSGSSSQSLASGANCFYALDFDPTISGAISGSAVLTDNSLNIVGSMQTISLSGTGVAADTTTVLSSSVNPSSFGQSVTFTATVAPTAGTALPVGTIQFSVDGIAVGGPVTLNGSGVASFTSSTLTVGSHSITAAYTPTDTTFNASTATPLNQVVNKATLGQGGLANITLTSAPNPSLFSQSVTFTATVPTGVTGSVNFMDGATLLGTGTISGTTVTFTTTTLAVGTHPATAVYGGNASFNAATSAIDSQVVNKATLGQGGLANITLTSAPNPSVFSQSVTFTATVPTGVTGTVSFMDGATLLGTGTISGTTATFTTTTLAVGTHPATAVYGGSANFNAATSTVDSQVVNKATLGQGGLANISLTSAPNPSVFSQSVTFTATVPTGVTGSVSFMDGTTLLGTGTISGTMATFTTTTLAVGTHPATAVYAGNANFNAATSAIDSQVVNKATLGQGGLADITLTSAPNPSTFNQSVTFTATVPTGVTGSVSFMDGTTLLGTGTISGTTATFTTTTLAVGTHPATAVYGGNTNFNAATSAIDSQVVNKATLGQGGLANITLTSAPNPSVFNQSVTFTATVPTGVTGSVSFMDGTMLLGTGTISGTTATFTTTTLAVGTHPATAVYAGNANFNAATSAIDSQVVNKATLGQGGLANITLTSAPNPSVFSQSVTFTATVPAGVTGSVSFMDGTTLLGTGTISGTTATFTTTTLAVGTHPATAVYGGNANFNAATSAIDSQVVNKATLGQGGLANITLTSAPNPSLFSQSVTFTATVPTGVTGSVNFMDGTTLLGTGTISGTTATFTTTTLAVGTHPATAVYGGNANFNAATSAIDSQVVNKATPTLTPPTVSPLNAPYGTSVTITETVPPGVTGTVTIYDGTTPIGTATISNGMATITTTSLPAGTDSITAVTSGDSNNAPGTSPAATDNISKATPTLPPPTIGPMNAPVGTPVTITQMVPPGETGTVTIYDGSTPIGTATINNGIATLTTTSLPGGTDSITVVTSGDSNYNSATTPPVVDTPTSVSSTPDFMVGTTTPTLTADAGATANFTITVAPTAGNTFNNPVTLSVTGLPAHATSRFAPPAITPAGGTVTTQMSVQTFTQVVAELEQKQQRERYKYAAFSCMLLPLLGIKRFRKRLSKAGFLMVLGIATLGATTALTGCGGGYFGPAPTSYTLTVTGTSGSLQHSTTVTLNVR